MAALDAEGPEMLPVEDGETVIRRFDPININHVGLDQGDGSIRLKSGALGIGRDDDGSSVYREAILTHYEIPVSSVIEANYSGLAMLSAGSVRDLGDVDVIPDPWPVGRDVGPDIDVAHSLITFQLSQSAARRKATSVARLANIVIPDRDATMAAIRGAGSGR
jgi:hypothetical protein